MAVDLERIYAPIKDDLQTLGDLTERRAASDPARDVLSLSQCECLRRAATDCRNNPTMTRQQCRGKDQD